MSTEVCTCWIIIIIKPKDFTGSLSDSDMADKFNDFFSNVGTELQKDIPNGQYRPGFVYPPIFEFNETDALTISEIIRDLSPSASYGTDGITSQLLKLACPYIVPVILHICNLSIPTKRFPELWKTATTTPLHKKGNHSDPTNFRPISILPCVSIIIEKIVHTQLYDSLTDNSILTPQQSGFHKGYSPGTCLVSFLDEIFQNIDEGVFSSPNSVTCGVPQGSVLGLLLIMLYVNNLPNEIVDGSSYLYADDTAISVCGTTGTEIEAKLIINLQQLHSWFNMNKLSLNLEKSQVMLFSTSHQLQKLGTVAVSHGNNILEVVNTFCYLGIMLDSRLSFSAHDQHIKSKTFSVIKLLGRVQHILDVNTTPCYIRH